MHKKWREWLAASSRFLRDEALSAAFSTAWPWIWAVVTTAIFALWSVLTGQAGPWVFLGSVLTFAATVFGVAVARSIRENVRAGHRAAVIAETAAIPDEDKGILDFGAGVEEALDEMNSSVPLLTREIERVAKRANLHGRRFRAAALLSFVKRRRVAMKAARDFEAVCDDIERRLGRVENAGATLQENFVGLVELLDEKATLVQLRNSAKTLATVIPHAVGGMEKFGAALKGLRQTRIQQHLGRSSSRMLTLVERTITTLQRTEATCKTVITEATKKLG